MSEAASQLVSAFSALPPQERHAVFVEIARISQSDGSPATDEELTYAGEQVFTVYDIEEQ